MKTVISLFAIAMTITSAAQAANLPSQCYQDAQGYATNKVEALSSNIVSAVRIGEASGTELSSDDGTATVTIEIEATYKNGAIQDYTVSVPVQLDDESNCSVSGQASVRRLN